MSQLTTTAIRADLSSSHLQAFRERMEHKLRNKEVAADRSDRTN